MDEERMAPAVEHLQRASRELIGAARLFLDAAEELVEDPRVMREVASVTTGVLSDVIAELRSSSWAGVRGAGRGARPFEADLDERDEEHESEHDETRDGGAGEPHGESARDAQVGQRDLDDEVVDLRERSDAATGRRRAGSRVRRIDVE